MAKRNFAIAIGNPIMKFMLRSPWHKVASKSIMLITVTGRKSGKRYTTPVNYIEDEDAGILTVLTHKHRTWWRNLRGNAPVAVVLRGERLTGVGHVYDEGAALTERFYEYLCAEPRLAPHLGVELNEHGTPDRAAAEKAAAGKVMVEVWLDGDYEEVDELATDQAMDEDAEKA
ncbi:MAG: nitroreductase/quinone reductase family protein [Caldilineaceae bacterium]